MTDQPTATSLSEETDATQEWRVEGSASSVAADDRGLDDTVVRLQPIRIDDPAMPEASLSGMREVAHVGEEAVEQTAADDTRWLASESPLTEEAGEWAPVPVAELSEDAGEASEEAAEASAAPEAASEAASEDAEAQAAAEGEGMAPAEEPAPVQASVTTPLPPIVAPVFPPFAAPAASPAAAGAPPVAPAPQVVP
ncbi:MAG: hypothetical protein WBB78_05500, partial [Propionicimonas sp.]